MKKVGLKLNIQKTKTLASSPITSWQIDGETVADFIFGGSKITADGDCSHEIKRFLLLRKESYDQPAAAKSLQLCPTLCDPIDGSQPGSAIYYREGNGTPPQYFCLENPKGRGAWWAAVHGVSMSRT